MIRQKDNTSVYKVVTDNRTYYVELIRLQNSYYGEPRYEAHIIRIDIIEECNYCGAYVYRFGGYHGGNEYEAKFIVDYHEKKILKTKS